MFDNSYENQKKEVSGWWNSDNIKKWDWMYDDYSIHDIEYLKNRQNIVIDLINNNSSHNNKILELGYGAGQTALELGKKGFEVHGLDISKNLYDIAHRRCKKNNPKGKYYLKVGSIESNYDYEENYFDIVVVLGALQYLHNIPSCLNEVYRVLKPGGFFIVAQRNHYSLSNMTSFRQIVRTIIHFIFREEHELFPSFKSILIDSKLGKIFKKFENSKFMNTNFMLKGHDNWKYKIDKKKISMYLMSKLLKNCGFRILNKYGSYYCFSEKRKYYNYNIKFDKTFKKIADKKYMPLLKNLGRSLVIISEKEEK